MKKRPTNYLTDILFMMGFVVWVLGGGIAFPQTPGVDTPDPPQTIQEESSTSPDQGEVIERGVIRDHRGQPKVFAPPRKTAPSQVAPAPIVRDHRQQTAPTTSPTTAISAQGAPPAIGPPAPVAPVKELPIDLMITNLKDATGKNIGVRGQVDTAIAAVNANAAQQTSVRAKIRVDSFTIYGAGMSATTYTDRPNQRFVNIPYMVGYKVYDVQKKVAGSWVATSVTRTLSQSISIQMFCDRWETGKGSLKLVTKIARPYMEPNQGIFEQVVDFFVNGHLTDFVDSQVRQQLNAIPIKNGSTNLPFACNTLSADKIDVATTKDDIIVYSDHLAPGSAVTGTTALNQISVKLVGLRRLVAHDLHGAVLYQPSEAPALEFYANSQHFYLPLSPIQEGQQILLNAQPLRMNPPGNNEPLVLVANIIQNVAVNTQPTDSAFLVLGKTMNYGNGTQTIRIPKFYIVQANPKTGAKPYKVPIAAYELTIQITGPGNLSADPGLGTTTTPGTVNPRFFNQAIQGTIMKRGIEGEHPKTEAETSESGVPAPSSP